LRLRKRKPSLRVGLPVLAIGIAMIVVFYLNADSSIQSGRPPPCFPETCVSLLYFAIIGLAGFFVSLWGAIETVFSFLIRPGYLEYQIGPLNAPEPGVGPEDETILAMARDLQRQVKRPRFGEITSLEWSSNQQWYWAGWKRRSIRKPFILLLSGDLRGRLEPQEWRILLTYYFLHLKPRLRIVLKYLGPLMGAFFILIPIGGILGSLAYGLQGGRLYGQFIAAPSALILLILSLPVGKRLSLSWDRWVAEEVGRSALLELFKKIDRLHLGRVENAKRRHGWVAHLWPMPNITERIQNLTDD